MTPKQFAKWRKKNDFSFKDVSRQLDITERTIQNYENGDSKMQIPRQFELSCLAMSLGISRFDGKYVYANIECTIAPKFGHKKLKKMAQKTSLFISEERPLKSGISKPTNPDTST